MQGYHSVLLWGECLLVGSGSEGTRVEAERLEERPVSNV